eukprot:1813003-Pleurochrysis_carterae.AAC.1
MIDHLREVLCVLSESEKDVQELNSRILRQPDRRVLTNFGLSPAERHRAEQRLTREVTERMLLLVPPAQHEATETPAGQPIELNPACTDPTPLQ